MFAPILAVLAASGAAAQSVVTPVTPSGLTQCVPILFQWSGGQAPYYVSIGSADTSSSPYVSFGTFNNNSFTWIVDQPVGTEVSLRVTDASGAGYYSAPVTVAAGSDNSCLSGSSSSGSSDSTESATTQASAESATSPAAAQSTESATTPAAAATSNSVTSAAASAAAGSATGSASSQAHSASSGSKASASATSAAAASKSSESAGERVLASTGLLAAAAAFVALF